MRIVTPVSTFDQHIAPKWCEVVKHLDCGRNHELHLVYPRSAEPAAHAIQNELQGNFEVIKMHLMESEPLGGWPYGPNTQFYASSLAMLRDNPKAAWFLCELDCYPMRSNSFDLLESRYSNAGVPFFGKIGPTFWRDDNGRITSSLFGKDDTTMSGCAVYPGNLLNRRYTSSLMADLMKGFDESTGAPSTGWDVHMRFAIKKEGVSDAGNLIADNWNTIKYKIEDGKLVCENNPDHEIYRRNPTFEHRKTNSPVGFDALFVHGCKDDSLPQLILSDSIPKESSASKPKVAEQSTAQADESAKLLAEMAEMKRMMEQQQLVIANLLQEKESKPVKETIAINPNVASIVGITQLPPGISPPPKPRPRPEPTAPTETELTLSEDEILRVVKGAGKALRSNDLAGMFINTNPQEVRDLAAKIPGLQVSGPPGYWVSLSD